MSNLHDHGASHLSEELNNAPSITFLTFIGILVVCTLIGNAITLMAIHVDRAMHSVGYLFIAFKAGSDLLLSTLVVPLAAVDDLVGYWPFNDTLCEIWMGLDVTLVTVQILILFGLAMDRYIHMKYPTFYLRYFSKSTVILINVILWMAGSAVFTIPWSLDSHRQSHRHDSHNRTICVPQYPPAMSFSFAAMSFVVPSVAMMVIYKKLYSYSKQTTQKFQLLFKTLQLNYPDLDPKIPFQSELRATTTIGLTMAAFIACWTPFFVAVMFKAVHSDFCCNDLTFKILSWIGYTNCALSPIIYATCNENFRASFLRLLGLISDETYQRKISVIEVKLQSKRASQESQKSQTEIVEL